MSNLPLGDFELLVMLAVLRVGEDAYSVPVRQEIEESTGSTVARGALYVTLDRLTKKGLLRSWVGEPTPERGGKAKRYYAATSEGLVAVRDSRAMLQDLWGGLEDVLDPA